MADFNCHEQADEISLHLLILGEITGTISDSGRQQLVNYKRDFPDMIPAIDRLLDPEKRMQDLARFRSIDESKEKAYHRFLSAHPDRIV